MCSESVAGLSGLRNGRTKRYQVVDGDVSTVVAMDVCASIDCYFVPDRFTFLESTLLYVQNWAVHYC